MTVHTEPKNIVIIGGGIIGCTSAYMISHHLSFDPSKTSITLLEATKIAGGASGKAGGLLALWAYPSSIVPLSYRLHKELADKHGGAERWGYRAVYCGQLETKGRSVTGPTVNGKEDRPTDEADGGALNENGAESVSLQKRSKEALAMLRAGGVPKGLDWVVPNADMAYDDMGNPTNTAQVHPYLFTTSMAELAQEKGVKIVYGAATSIDHSSNAVTGVTYEDKETGESKTLEADTVVLSAGPWTQQVYPPAPIAALRAHSVTIRPSRPVSAYALFTHIIMPGDKKTGRKAKGVTPEIYARPNNEVYACGEGDHLVPLPATTDLVSVDQQRCQDIVDQVSSISDELRDGEVTARQACYLPNVSAGGGPLIGETGIKGFIMAAGHTCWGIQNGPGTGKLVSEFVWEGKAKSAKIGSLDPRSYM
ncbi:FAD dependent oxidoreductase [Rhizodiscina lignyota]|uniref:FAD dependent oxidoreductase n=1 Tax=Rhizodiscina lignyota TaxID=1504668 RepID=A0A9P4IDN8_9PEZI|nr:FAD dependent oxidoreductase [Rhizodiscina lignyota]